MTAVALTLSQRARSIIRDPFFWIGSKEMGGTALGIAAWGLVTGVAMVKSGLSVPLALLMGFTAYAGSAQLAVLPLIAVGAPLWVVWFTAICVNLRFVILSSMWRSYFSHLSLRHRLAVAYFSGDVIFVNFMRRYPEAKPQAEQLPYFWGAALTNWLAWQIPSTLGIFLADQIPLSWGLGFAGVLALVGVLLSMLNDRATWVASVVACSAAVAAFALPLKLNILVAIAAAVAAGLTAEQLQKQAKQLPKVGDEGESR
ncbi:MAG: AzlC family ABC transporter permease [Comamonas sp.]|jgi:predicted branched-subunit amino acid permease|uniref:AzlC family ABC transporter permease n=1 Tax=Comamonas sp. TaxID=34028 RepID=UPI00281F06AB|nr:AzlC family ABC transporter permease [Comamonas sp.]MDR0214785.1 AzlC family ABC transporter permease [Comamonas sp.]MDR2300142.1 AzlC family ABC transporter permease [Comamonas sp.]